MKANALLAVVSDCPRAWFPRKAEAIDRREIGARRQTLQVLTTRKRSVLTSDIGTRKPER